jgi:hydrogenase maturation protease
MSTLLLGLGNVLMGDDGFGPFVVRAFEERYELGPGAEAIDLGTPGLDLTPWLADADHVIVVDTVKASGAPGTLHVYEQEEVVRHAPVSRVSPHDPGLKESLLMLEFAGRAPRRLTLIGVVPARVALGTDLSCAVRDAVPAVLGAIRTMLANSGIAVRARDHRPTSTNHLRWWCETSTGEDSSRIKASADADSRGTSHG